jgi:hypothetical protein
MPEGPTRCVQSQEDFPIIGLRTDFADVPCYRVCERGNEGRNAGRPMLFGCGDRDGFLFPVYVVQTKPLDFTYAQSVHGEQEKDGTVTDVGLPIRFRAGQEPQHICPRRTERELFMLIDARAANRISYPRLRPSHLFAIAEEHAKMVSSAGGHYAYYGIAGNIRALQRVHRAVERYWRKMLSSRSWQGQVWWKKFQQIKERFPLLRPKLYLSYSELQAIATL